ncbi:MAG TPA: GH3 auxin-responsive promoter family protein [Syntrophomonadaceae bacterium]|mgnify:CR=1 FL=1|nr:GH3 auxin-responsive promoter family protein [Syntrophomonadaceae bacterium]HPR93233.1 GH3 auxin-responsive promoter family protein [Syntrophomonadaceae bacterium]
MNLGTKLKEKQFDRIWQEYCGFLDFSMDQYMEIQNRLMLEQIEIYAGCELGRRIMKGNKPSSVDEFRQMVPLTRYENYADLLLPRIDSVLPSKPLLWIETTWEGAKNPIKVAPYTESMIRYHKSSFITCLILATSNEKGQFSLRGGENFLYGMAPLPYLTGLAPLVLEDEISVNWLPPAKEAVNMSFSQRNKLGFQLGMQQGVDLFFGLSSVIAKIGDQFTSAGGSDSKINPLNNSAKMNYRLLKAWKNSREDKTPIQPKDIWTLKGLICAGTDSASVKSKIEKDWGVRPLEIFGGTETTCIATETWSKNGLVFIPDVCFYEFIPWPELQKNLDDPDYIPRTYLINELQAGTDYELVISNFKGGAFARYRVGDIFKCISLSNEADDLKIPQFTYIDREPGLIDIAGFTRISETTINEALKLSKLEINDWIALKEFDDANRAFLHLIVEISPQGMQSAVTRDIINEHLAIYFRYIDTDYKDLKSLLGIEPLKITIIPTGTIARFSERFGRKPRKMNPSHFDMIELLKLSRSNNTGV